MGQATAATTKPNLITRYVPILGWLPKYDRGWLRLDLIAGLTVVALLVPEGMAYAELAGMPPETAFYAAIPALLLYAVFGTSRQLVVATSSTFRAKNCTSTVSAGATACTSVKTHVENGEAEVSLGVDSDPG